MEVRTTESTAFRKTDVHKTSIFCLKNLSPGQFWGAPTHEDIIEFQKFLLQLKNQRSGSKAVCGFSIISILKGIMTFYRGHAFR